jgi:hypothetical protein
MTTLAVTRRPHVRLAAGTLTLTALVLVGIVLKTPAPAWAETGAWSPTGSMLTGRSGFVLTMLVDGRVLAPGGSTDAGPTATAELYDPATGTWSPTGSMTMPRIGYATQRLQDGRVLIAGGLSPNGITATAELCDPHTGLWTITGAMHEPRRGSASALLPDGRVLVTGGVTGNANIPTNTAETYNPVTGSWTTTAAMTNHRWLHRASVLANGRVLVAGGSGPGGHCVQLPTAEIYRPDTQTWTHLQSMTTARSFHAQALLPDGRVLVAGGWTQPPPGGCPQSGMVESATATAELFTPSTGAWSSTGALMIARGNITQALLADGRVLVAGGRISAPGPGTLDTATAELFNPATGMWASAGTMSVPRSNHSIVRLSDGRILVAGGSGTTAPLTTTEIYTPGNPI